MMGMLNVIRNEVNALCAIGFDSIGPNYTMRFPLRMEYYRYWNESDNSLELKLKT